MIRNLYGHGTGRAFHEAPSVPTWTPAEDGPLGGTGTRRRPFLSTAATYVVDDPDGWTLRTSDGSIVAQLEHTMMVAGDGPLVLTA